MASQADRRIAPKMDSSMLDHPGLLPTLNTGYVLATMNRKFAPGLHSCQPSLQVRARFGTKPLVRVIRDKAG